MVRISVDLPDATWTKLRTLSEAERRDPRAQVAVLVEKAVRRLPGPEPIPLREKVPA
jgi:hypothetical protein